MKINLEKLTLNYLHNQNPVLKQVDLTINQGDYIALIGANGSGKSTLALLLAGFFNNYDGKYFLNNFEITNEMIRGKIGILFQNPDNQLVSSIVESDIAFGLENRNINKLTMQQKVLEILKKLNLLNYKEANVNLLSGGQKQKLALAGLLVLDLDFYIFDEATAMLDRDSRNEILQLIDNLNKIENKTILHITHHLSEAFLAQRILIINNGVISELTQNELIEHHNDVNYLNSLIFNNGN